MSFGAPSLLALLLGLPVLAAAYMAVQRRRPRYTARFTNLALLASVAPRRPGGGTFRRRCTCCHWARWSPPWPGPTPR
jgi:hypothetical protein